MTTSTTSTCSTYNLDNFASLVDHVADIASTIGIQNNRTYGHADVSEYLTGRELVQGTAYQAWALDMTDEQISADLSGWEVLPTTYYMNPETGSVDTIEGWREDYEDAARHGDAEDLGFGSSFEECLSRLTEVRRTETEEEEDRYGEWMAV